MNPDVPNGELMGQFQAGQRLLWRADIFVQGCIAGPSQEMQHIAGVPGEPPLLLQSPQRFIQIGAPIEREAASRGKGLCKVFRELPQLSERGRRVLMERPFRKGAKPRELGIEIRQEQEISGMQRH
jgi:hypothetical protein